MSDVTFNSGRTVDVTDAHGTIRDWFVSQVWATPCEDLAELLAPDGEPWGEGRWVLTNGPDVGPFKERLAEVHPIAEDVALPEIVEGGPVEWVAEGRAVPSTGRRRRTGWDGYVDWSAFCFTPEYRCSIAATVIEVDQAEWRTIELSTTGPFVLWLNGEVVLRGGTVSYMEPEVHRVRVRIPSRTSTIHVATWQVAFRECRHIVRLRVLGLPVRVVLPSPGADETAARLASTVLARIASRSWAIEGTEGVLEAPPGVALRIRVSEGPWQHVRVDDDGLARYSLVEAEEMVDEGGDTERSAGASMLTSGESIIEVGVDDDRCPQTVALRVAVLPPGSREVAVGGPAQWRQEVLAQVTGESTEHGAPREAGVASVLARHALDPATRVTRQDVASALHRVVTRGDCADFEAVALVTAWHRVPAQQWDAGVRESVEEALTGLRYWITQPGLDAMCFFTENHQLVWHTAEHLVGSAFPDATFAADGRSGREHAAEGLRRAAAWIGRKLAGGFSEFDSNAYLAIDSYALVSLVELGENEDLRLAARTLLDKILLTLAANSWRGIHGAAHGRSYVHTLRSSRYEETSPILRLIAGVGTLNDAVLPVTALALAERYEIPDVVRTLVTEPAPVWWGRQVYRGKLAFERDLLERPYRSDVRVWRTPDVMLSSVQDYRSGLPGLQEHVWGATLGREAQVFVTHPANADTGSSARPNGWVGHRTLPRVHQERNAVIHLQRFTHSDPARYTHLWLPLAQLDEHRVEGDWILARRGDGYVAVATQGGVSPVTRGDTAWQEWRSATGGAAWVATVGSRSENGPFGDWVAQVLGGTLIWGGSGGSGGSGSEEPSVTWTRTDGPDLELSFDGPFLVDGRPAGFVDGVPETEPHLDNPALRLEFGQGEATATWGGASFELPVAVAIAAAQRAGDAGAAGEAGAATDTERPEQPEAEQPETEQPETGQPGTELLATIEGGSDGR